MNIIAFLMEIWYLRKIYEQINSVIQCCITQQLNVTDYYLLFV